MSELDEPGREGRPILLTGGASGIGRAIARALRETGRAVLVCDRVSQPEWESAAEYMQVDLTDVGDLEALRRRLDGVELGGLVHCAAVTHWSSILETPRDEWERVLRVNLHATIGLAQTIVPLIANGGRVVFFGSGTVHKGPRNVFAYAASKAGVIGFARCLADEVGDREITVNVINPGITRTPMAEPLIGTEDANIASRALKRPAYPEDLVGPVLFLLSDGAAFVTGQSIMVDGGSIKR